MNWNSTNIVTLDWLCRIMGWEAIIDGDNMLAHVFSLTTNKFIQTVRLI